MRPRLFLRCAAPILLLVHLASADVSPEAKVRAQQRFQEGEKAYKEGDYREAAEAFEAAYREVHHHVPLFNAARAWAKAGERGRAATDYDRFLDIAPAQDPDRPTATTALKQLSGELGQLQIARDEVDAVKVDGVDVDGARVFVAPGSHEIEGKKGDKLARKTEKVGAGEVVHVRLELPKNEPAAPPVPVYVTPPSAPAASPQPAPALATSPVPEAPKSSGWSPTVVWVGAGVTGFAGLLTILSGLDTVAYKHSGDFASHPDGDTLGVGLAKERRTNVLLGTTIVMGVLTGVAALFFVDWKSTPDTKVGAR